MSNDFMNINFEDINLDEYKSIEMKFSKEEKDNIKKNLRSKIIKRKNIRNGLVAAAAAVAISVVLGFNGGNVVAKVLPAFDKIYAGLGFKSEYLSKSAYIGKTYEENGIKVTLENLVATKHIIKVALKVQYGDKWAKAQKPSVFFGYSINGKKLETGSFGGSKNIDDNTELKVLNFCDTDKEFPSKLDFKIEAFSDAFKNPLVWNINQDFSKNFKETIEKQVTMSKNIGVTINHIESSSVGTIINSNKWLGESNENYFLKIDNKIYPLTGGGSGNENSKNYMMYAENIGYDAIKNGKNISLVKHSIKKIEDDDKLKNMTKEEGIEYDNKIEKQLDNLPKGEIQGVVYTKEITFKNGNKAEIYNIERKNKKIRVYIKGNDKKQVFSAISRLYTSTGELVESIEDNGVGYIAEFDDISQENVAIKMTIDILNYEGYYNEDESRLTLR